MRHDALTDTWPQGGVVVAEISARGENAALAAVRKAHEIVHAGRGQHRITDLTKTSFEDVRSSYFRLFVPVKYERMRLPTTLPEFSEFRHHAALSDSPVTAAATLGGHWSEHNLAAITHVAACNFRCSYCYVDYRLLAGDHARRTTAGEIVTNFVDIRRRLAEDGQWLSILRVSGGEPLLAPDLITEVHQQLDSRGLLDSCMVKVESNLSALPYSYGRLDRNSRAALRDVSPQITLHATLHAKPGERDWPLVRQGLALAVDLGMDVYPAIGGADWTTADMRALFDALQPVARGLVHRLAVRPFNLSYAERHGRRPALKEAADRPPSLSASAAWEELLQERTGDFYLARPRHVIGLR